MPFVFTLGHYGHGYGYLADAIAGGDAGAADDGGTGPRYLRAGARGNHLCSSDFGQTDSPEAGQHHVADYSFGHDAGIRETNQAKTAAEGWAQKRASGQPASG